MKRSLVALVIACAACGWLMPMDLNAQPATMNFDALLDGTTFGTTPGHTPGEVVHTEHMIAMSVEEFFIGQFVGFNNATVGGRFTDYVDTERPLDLNNISVRFDFTDLGFNVTGVTLDTWEFGGADNFSVNDETVHIVNALAELPSDVALGVTATVVDHTITLDGKITSFQIGGQELSIDNIVAVPEPTSLILAGLGAVALLRRRRR
jgi:hypothetical protein